MTARIELANLSDLLQRYVAGESENKLAREAGINRWTFRRRLLEAGIAPRNQSESESVKWANMSPATRRAQVAAAHNAVRGTKRTYAAGARRALGVQRTLANASPIEFALADALRERGLSVTQQRAIGMYNVDVALDACALAVEVFGGNWHACGSHAARFHQRVVDLLNGGWHLVIIWVDGRRYPLGVGAINHLVALSQELGRNPAAPRQYRVMLGNGQPAPIRQMYLNTPADIERLGCRLDAAGCYHLIAG